mgnify:CR=1 FL=1
MADPKVLEQVFNEFDLDKSGFLTQNELEAVLGQIAKDGKSGITAEDISKACGYIVQLADKNQDGKISKSEFVKFTREYIEKK